MEDFEKKVSIADSMDVEHDSSGGSSDNSPRSQILQLLRKFLGVQQRRAEAYSRLKQYEHIHYSVWGIYLPFVVAICSV